MKLSAKRFGAVDEFALKVKNFDVSYFVKKS
jgi:hypothetical protein